MVGRASNLLRMGGQLNNQYVTVTPSSSSLSDMKFFQQSKETPSDMLLNMPMLAST
jgi:hypothetical protein